MDKDTPFLRSSIGQKFLMATTGLFLCTFLVEHMIANLLILNDDGGALYDAYTEFMTGNLIVRTIEIGLFGSLIGHAIVGAVLWIGNRRKRSTTYEMNAPGDNSTLTSRIMFLTGSIVFLFLVVHLRTFFVPMRFSVEHVSGYRLVVDAFSNPVYSGFYLLALILLGFHLRQGFQSAFQTYGLLYSRYKRIVEFFGFLMWCVVPAGFAIIPLYFLFTPGGYQP